MRDVLMIVRFFRLVSPLPPLMGGTFGALAVLASLIVPVDASRTDDVLIPVLALQLFAASSGFAGPARRGYYDTLLTAADRRALVGLVHWLMSTTPGCAVWLWIAGLEAFARRGFPSLALADGSLGALAIVSMLGWALTVGLPRFSAAIAWIVALAGAMRLWRLERLFVDDGSSVVMAAAALVNPAVLVGRAMDPAETVAVLAVLSIGVAGVILACAWIASIDYPLEVAQ